MWYRLREGKSSTEAANHMQIFKILWQWIKGNLMYDLLKSIYGLVIGTAGFAWLMDYLNQPITGTIAAWLLCTYGVAFIIYLLLVIIITIKIKNGIIIESCSSSSFKLL